MPDIRGITRGYMFNGTRQDLTLILKLVKNGQLSIPAAFDLIEQYVISGRELPDYVPEYEPQPTYLGD